MITWRRKRRDRSGQACRKRQPLSAGRTSGRDRSGSLEGSSENSKSPFRGLECLRPFERGERCVAVATDLLYRAVALFCRSDGYTALLWLDSAQCPHPISRQAEPRAIEAPLHRQLCQLRCNSVVTALTSTKSRYLLRNRRQGDPLQLYGADHRSQAHHPLVGTCLY